jgi:hypothetical protein
MPQITFDGKFYHAGIAGDPVVILHAFEEGPFRDWCQANAVFTKIMEHRDPTSGIDRPAIYVTETSGSGLDEGAPARITIDVRPEKEETGSRLYALRELCLGIEPRPLSSA